MQETCIFSRGDDFCKAFATIGELRSIIPSSVCIMALTATATHVTFEAVKRPLSLQDPILVGPSPNRSKIFLAHLPLEVLVEKTSLDLQAKRTNYPKTIIFCRTYTNCSDLYAELIIRLGDDKTEPSGYLNLLKYHLLTMYTIASTDAMKKDVVSLFTQRKFHFKNRDSYNGLQYGY